MIWYRHWLEVRGILWLTVIVVLLFTGPRLHVFVFGGDAEPNAFARALLSAPLADTIGREALLAWFAFAERIWMGVFVTGFFLAGNGLRSLAQPGYPGASYTLTLPVSRRHLIGTRFVVSAIGIVFVVLLSLAAHVTDLLLRGARVPLAVMVASFLFSVPAAIAWAAVMTACVTFLRVLWAFLLGMLLSVPFVVPVRDMVTAVPAHGEMPWAVVGGAGLLTALALWLTLLRGPAREFS